MSSDQDKAAPLPPAADAAAAKAAVLAKEPWETPRVIVAAVKEATAYYGGHDDHAIIS